MVPGTRFLPAFVHKSLAEKTQRPPPLRSSHTAPPELSGAYMSQPLVSLLLTFLLCGISLQARPQLHLLMMAVLHICPVLLSNHLVSGPDFLCLVILGDHT